LSKPPAKEAASEAPSDLILVGYVSGAYGLKGWVKIRPYSQEADALVGARTWWLDKPEMRDVQVLQSRLHVDEVVAQLMGVADRDAAEALKGATVQIRRSHFPALDNNEFYWVDLIGLSVENLHGEALGKVSELMDNGAHPIMVVQSEDVGADGKPRQWLIPFVEQFVPTVDVAARRIVVDWEKDY
jgi:16S rRNA processing protein RimM